MQKLADRTPQSKERYERGVKVMPNGVPSSFQVNEPWPVYLERGQGAPRLGRRRQRVRRLPQRLRRDVRRPRQPDDRRRRSRPGSTSAPTSPLPPRARSSSPRSCADRFGLPQWRFTNSGTESTMDADPPRPRSHRPRRDPQDRGLLPRPPRRGHGLRLPAARGARATATTRASVPYGAGYPLALTELTRAVPFNDADALESVLEQARGPGRRADHGAGDDEHQHHPAGRGLPRAGARADCTRTASS